MGACCSGMCFIEDEVQPEVQPELQQDDSSIDSFGMPASPGSLVSTGSFEPQDRYDVIEGRLYEKNSNYILPVDNYELQRMETSYRILEHVWGDDMFVPQIEELLMKGGEVLDCGCGSGLYILETAARLPNSSFIGIDIAPLFPTVKPKNVNFVEGDCRKRLPFADGQFSYVHQCALSASYSRDEWLGIALGEIVRVTRPGGWVAFIEYASQFHNIGAVTQRLNGALQTLLSSRGMDLDAILDLPVLMKASGQFSDISLVERTVPMGMQAGRTLHHMITENYQLAYHSLRPYLRTIMGITDEHYDALIEAAVREITMYNTRFTVRRVVARKK